MKRGAVMRRCHGGRRCGRRRFLFLLRWRRDLKPTTSAAAALHVSIPTLGAAPRIGSVKAVQRPSFLKSRNYSAAVALPMHCVCGGLQPCLPASAKRRIKNLDEKMRANYAKKVTYLPVLTSFSLPFSKVVPFGFFAGYPLNKLAVKIECSKSEHF